MASYADEGPTDEDTAEEDTAQAASSELIEFNAIAARNQAAMSLRTSDEPENIRPVRVDDIEFIAPCMGAALPPVCPGCGNPGTNERLERYRKSADWLLIFNLFSFTPGVIPMSLWYLRFGGLVPYLVISAIFGTQGSIAIFVCDNCLKRVKTRKASGVVLLAAGISAGAAALVFKIPQLFALAAPLVLLGTVFAMDKLLRVKRAAKRDGVMEFRFTRGHTRFLVAIKHMYP